MNVLSLCDGISCGHIALDRANIPVDKYFSAEIKGIAIKTTQYNYPETIQIGDVNKIFYKDGVLFTENGQYKIDFDLVIFGSPCQSFSRAMIKERRIGLEDKVRSGLFLECYRILKEVNPKYFLVENVVMTKENEDIITELLGVKPVRINSSLVSAQLRDRLYWTNIKFEMPKDKGIKLQDILIDGYCPLPKARCLLANESHGFYEGCHYNKIKRFARTFKKSFGTMVAPNKEYFNNCMNILNKIIGNNEYSAKLLDNYLGNDFDEIRYLTKEERARLQTVPEDYISTLTEKEAADVLGDGWTVDVIAHIFKGLKLNTIQEDK